MPDQPEHAIKIIEHRRFTHKQWLLNNYPEVFEEQKHTDEGTQERVYWHYGYIVALSDVLRWLAPSREDHVVILLREYNPQ